MDISLKTRARGPAHAAMESIDRMNGRSIDDGDAPQLANIQRCKSAGMHASVEQTRRVNQTVFRFFGRPFVKTVRPMLSDHCLSCLVLSCMSVTLAYCGQT